MFLSKFCGYFLGVEGWLSQLTIQPHYFPVLLKVLLSLSFNAIGVWFSFSLSYFLCNFVLNTIVGFNIFLSRVRNSVIFCRNRSLCLIFFFFKFDSVKKRIRHYWYTDQLSNGVLCRVFSLFFFNRCIVED